MHIFFKECYSLLNPLLPIDQIDRTHTHTCTCTEKRKKSTPSFQMLPSLPVISLEGLSTGAHFYAEARPFGEGS